MAQPGMLFFGERTNEDFIRQATINLPSTADVLGAHAAYLFNEISPFQLARLAIYRASPYLPGLASETLDSEEWVNSEYFRDELAFIPGMTRLYAWQLAQEFDKRQAWNQIIERGPQGAKGLALSVFGSLIGGVPDPVNYFPIIAGAGKVRIINRMSKFTRGFIKNPQRSLSIGRTAGSAVTGGLDASLATALITPVFIEERKTSQDNISVGAALVNIGIAAGIGSGFGAIGNVISRKVRHNTLMLAHQRAVGQMVDGQEIDVSTIIQKELADNPTIVKEDGIENIRYDVAKDPDIIPTKRIRQAENDLRLIIANEIPVEDVTLPKMRTQIKEQFVIESRDISRSLDAFERAGLEPNFLVRFAEDSDRLVKLASDNELIEAISTFKAAGLDMDDVAELLVQNPRVLKDIGSDFRRIRDLAPLANRARQDRVKAVRPSTSEEIIDAGKLAKMSDDELAALAKKEGIDPRLLVTPDRSTLEGAILDIRRIKALRSVVVSRGKVETRLSEVREITTKPRLTPKQTKVEIDISSINLFNRARTEVAPGRGVKDLPKKVLKRVNKIRGELDKIVKAKDQLEARDRIIALSKTTGISRETIEDLAKLEAQFENRGIAGLSDTPPPTKKVIEKIDDAVADTDKKLEELFDTADRIEREVGEEQSLLSKYINCLED